MKKDSIFLIGGLALGAVVFFVFKEDILGKKKSAPPQTSPPSGGSVSGGSMNTGIGAPNEEMQGQSQTTIAGQQQPTPPPPYALNPIDPALASTQVHQDLFGVVDLLSIQYYSFQEDVCLDPILLHNGDH